MKRWKQNKQGLLMCFLDARMYIFDKYLQSSFNLLQEMDLVLGWNTAKKEKKPLRSQETSHLQLLSEILVQILLQSLSGLGEFEVSPCQSWQILSLCLTLQTIYCLLTLYLKQFSLLMESVWCALKSSLSPTYQAPHSMKSQSFTLHIYA